jgi:dihydroorotate dehydrogenase (NAD+) catalytic subunit
VDVEKRVPKLANVAGGLSGPAIKPVALHMVYQVAGTVKIPVIGMGGITNHTDALEFLVAGASAVQVGTANFVSPRATIDIIEGLENYCAEKQIESISEIIGSLRVPSAGPL